ncbi:unnamed protein product, partial [Trichogramma brassicae]
RGEKLKWCIGFYMKYAYIQGKMCRFTRKRPKWHCYESVAKRARNMINPFSLGRPPIIVRANFRPASVLQRACSSHTRGAHLYRIHDATSPKNYLDTNARKSHRVQLTRASQINSSSSSSSSRCKPGRGVGIVRTRKRRREKGLARKTELIAQKQSLIWKFRLGRNESCFRGAETSNVNRRVYRQRRRKQRRQRRTAASGSDVFPARGLESSYYLGRAHVEPEQRLPACSVLDADARLKQHVHRAWGSKKKQELIDSSTSVLRACMSTSWTKNKRQRRRTRIIQEKKKERRKTTTSRTCATVSVHTCTRQHLQIHTHTPQIEKKKLRQKDRKKMGEKEWAKRNKNSELYVYCPACRKRDRSKASVLYMKLFDKKKPISPSRLQYSCNKYIAKRGGSSLRARSSSVASLLATVKISHPLSGASSNDSCRNSCDYRRNNIQSYVYAVVAHAAAAAAAAAATRAKLGRQVSGSVYVYDNGARVSESPLYTCKSQARLSCTTYTTGASSYIRV